MKPVVGPSFVTGISPDGRVPGYLIIEIDGTRFASLPAEIVSSVGLGAGARVQSEAMEALNAAADAEAAFQVGLRALRAAERSVFDLRKKLGDRGFRGAVAAQAIGRLQDQGYLDDEKYARNFVEVRLSRGHGRSKILSDLARRGVDREIAESMVQAALADTDFDETAEIEEAAQKRLSQLSYLSPVVQKRRLLGFLQRRGYSGGEVFSIVDRLIAGADSD